MANKSSHPENELNQLIPPFEQRGMNLGIERMQLALKAMGEPCATIPAIQIVGTNGKGSIASFIQSSLKCAGIKAGVTTSPHLMSWRERIRIDGNLISSQELRQRIFSLQSLAKDFQLTPFELIMATAFDHFAEHDVEILVLEVGLGGRLDATTAHPLRPIIAMASIGLDHCEHLGDNLKDIAKEKSAVISSGCKVISSTQHKDVSQVIEETTNARHAELEWVSSVPHEWNLGINGEIQKKNAAVARGALQSLEKLGWKINDQIIREGLALANWPGRLQKINWNGFPLLLDGAHNPHAAEQLSIERCHWDQQKTGLHWILGIQSHKAAPSILRNLLKPSDTAWIVPVPNHKSWEKFQLSIACPELANQIVQANDVEEALQKLLLRSKWPTPPPVIAGSLYLIGDLMLKYVDIERREANQIEDIFKSDPTL